MTIIRTGNGLTRRDVRRLEQGRYEILAIETLHLARPVGPAPSATRWA